MRFSKPTLKLCSVDSSNRKYVIDIQNLTKTMGHSIGNALVRGLMTAECYKPKAYKMENAFHEFDAVRGVVQDIEEISNRISKLIVPPVKGNTPLNYEFNGEVEGKLTAGQFVNNQGVGGFVNDSFVILETSERIHIRIVITATKGTGHEIPPYPEFNHLGMIELPVVYSGLQASYELFEDKPYVGTETVRLIINSNGGYDVVNTVELVCRQFTAYFDIIANTFASITINTDPSNVIPAKVTRIEAVRLEDLDLPTNVYDRLKLNYNEVEIKDGSTILLPKSEERERCKMLLEDCGLKVELI